MSKRKSKALEPCAPPPQSPLEFAPLAVADELERLVLETLPKNADGDEHPPSSFHFHGPKDRPDWTVENVEAALRRLSERPAGYAPVKRCADCGWYTVLPALPLDLAPLTGTVQSPAQGYATQLIDLAQKGSESCALSPGAVDLLESAAATLSMLLNVECRLREPVSPAATPYKPMSKKYDAWAGANPVVGTEEHLLVTATSEALCRELVWRLVQQRLPDECARALLTALLATAQRKEA